MLRLVPGVRAVFPVDPGSSRPALLPRPLPLHLLFVLLKDSVVAPGRGPLPWSNCRSRCHKRQMKRTVWRVGFVGCLRWMALRRGSIGGLVGGLELLLSKLLR